METMRAVWLLLLLSSLALVSNAASVPSETKQGKGTSNVVLSAIRRVVRGQNLDAVIARTANPSTANAILKRTIKLKTCNRTSELKMKRYFRNVVLIVHINYGWVARKTSAFWRQVYGGLFTNIVILSDEDIPDLGVEARSSERWVKDWRMCYSFLPKIMARYPNAEGFLWTNDDVVINYWNLVGADKTKLWLPNDPKDRDVRWFPRNPTLKFLWKDDWPAINRWRNTIRYALDRMDAGFKAQYAANILPHVAEYPKRITDLFYIPRRHVEKFSFDLLPIFQMAGAPSELAIPAMFHVLDHPKNWDPVLNTMVFRWDMWEAKVKGKRSEFKPEEAWSPKVPGFHPWKVSKAEAKGKLLQALVQADPCLWRRVRGIALTD